MAKIAENVRTLADRAKRDAGTAGLTEPGVNHWLVAVLAEFAPLVAKLTAIADANTLRENAAAAAAKGDFGAPAPVEGVLADASSYASGRGSEVVQAKDLVAAVLKAAGLPVSAEAGEAQPIDAVPAADPAQKRDAEPAPQGAPAQPTGTGTPTIDQFGRDITAEARSGALRAIYGRDEEIRTVIEVLCRTEKRNPLLVGPAGSGKTAIVEGFASRVAAGDVPDMLKGVRVLAIETSALVSGTSYVGSFEERMRKVIAEASRPDVILFVDEAHTVMGAGSNATGMADMLKPALARGELALIAATTDDEYRRHIQPDRALSRRFQPIMVNEMDAAQALEVLKLRRDALREKRGVEVSDDVLSGLVNFAEEYLRSRTFPDKALDLLEQVVAHAVAAGGKSVSSEMAAEVTSRLAGHPTPPAEALDRLRREFKALGLAKCASAEKVVARLTTTLHALDVDARRPNLVAVLCGDAAAQAAETARALARALYGSAERVIELDLHQMRDEESINALIGPPPGYIGFGGTLPIHALAVTPCAVVVIDGADVCHETVAEVVANGLAQGYIEDSAGGRYYLSDAVVLVPLSEDSPEARKVPFGAAFGAAEAPARQAADAESLAEAVLGRALARQMDMVLADLVATADAGKDAWLRDSVLPKVAQRFEKRGLRVTWDDAVVDLLAKETAKFSDLPEVERYTEDLVSGVVLAKVKMPAVGEVRQVRLAVTGGAVVAEEQAK